LGQAVQVCAVEVDAETEDVEKLSAALRWAVDNGERSINPLILHP
jgi:hypothetical protein